MQLSLEQLSSLKTQHENEIQELGRQMESLYGAKSRYNNAKAVLGDINTCPAGNALMIPLNSSLYVPGKIINPDKVFHLISCVCLCATNRNCFLSIGTRLLWN